MYPRDGPGSMELVGGTGPTTAAVSCGDFLEIYKSDRTFKVLSPESIDPQRTNPNAPWVTTSTAEVGSSNPIVARILIQSHNMVSGNMFAPAVNGLAVTLHMHAMKEALLICNGISRKISTAIRESVEAIRSGQLNMGSGRTVSPPVVPDLEAECANFLIHAKRTIKLISELPGLFLRIKGSHNNLADLGKALAGLLGGDHQLTKLALTWSPQAKYLIDLRNFHEHPRIKKTVIRDFHVLADGSFSAPTWQVVGGERAEPGFIEHEMTQSVELLLNLGEAVFLYLVENHLPFLRLPARIEQVATEKIDPNFAVKYRLEFYMPGSSAPIRPVQTA